MAKGSPILPRGGIEAVKLQDPDVTDGSGGLHEGLYRCGRFVDGGECHISQEQLVRDGITSLHHEPFGFGLSLALNRLPIEIYLEATPSIFMFPVAFGFLPGGTLGARIYF